MDEIQVNHERGDIYRVEVSEGGETSTHRVAVPPEELQRYGGGAEPEELLVASFRFLLEREPLSAILSRFELSTIERYFPEYPDVISERI
jgi:hypothetical protein